MKNRNEDVFTFVNKIKQYALLNKFKNPFKTLALRRFITKIKDNERKDNIRFITKIKDNERKDNILLKLKNILPKRNDTNNEILLSQYVSLWLDKINKMKEREQKLNKAMEALKQNQLKSDINTLTQISLIKKLIIKKIRTKN